MPHSRSITAVPFVGKDVPSERSEFAHPDIVISLTILAFRYVRLLALSHFIWEKPFGMSSLGEAVW